MKKTFTLIPALSLCIAGAFGQATPNASFENWTHNSFPSYDTPDNWDNANPQTAITGQFGCIKATAPADVHSGNAAVKLITKNILSVDAPGVITTGTLPTATGDPITGGIAYTLRPDSIVGWYKYTPQGADNGFAEFMLFGSAANNADTIAKAHFSTPNATISSYTRFSAPLTYYNNNAVANSIWLISSSKDDVSPVIGSTIIVDDLDLIINPATPVSASISSQTNVQCNGGCTGTATAGVTGGTAPYTYQWSNSQSASTATGLCANTYSVTVTGATGGTSTASVTITQPATAVSATATATPATCYGTNTGSLTASGSGGASGYSYSWSGGLGSGQNKTNVPAGTYIVTVTDANGCTATATTTITQPAAVSAIVTGQTDVSCNGGNDGTATITASGGTTPFTYIWSNGQSASTATGLASGNYNVTVTDANACTQSATAAISQPNAIVITLNATDASCGSSNGTATASAGGGTGALTYLWSTAETTQNITGLGAGNYSVTVTDFNGCTATDVVAVNETGGATLSVTSQQDVSCNGGNNGAVSVAATGGTPPYTYAWNGGSSLSAVSGLQAGAYSLTVTTSTGCASFLNITVTEPQPVTASATGTDVACNGGNNGTAAVTWSGGTPPYTFTWSNGQSLYTATGLAAGSYSVSVTDSCGSQAVAPVTINQPTLLTATLVSTPDSGSSNGTATALASGGTTPYSYTWSGNGQTTATATGLAAGNYSVTTTDANGCTLVNSVTVNVYQGIKSPVPAFASEVLIYPNPADKLLIVEAGDAAYGNYEIKILNIAGQVLQSETFYHNGGGMKKEINIADLSNGLMLVQVISDNASVVMPVMK